VVGKTIIGQKEKPKIAVVKKSGKKARFFAPASIMIMGTFYNAFLAFMAARGFPVNETVVSITELLVVSMGAAYIFIHQKELKKPLIHYAFFMATVVFCFIVMAANGIFLVKFIRDMLLIVLFILLGSLCKEEDLIKAFKIISIMVLIGALLEIRFTQRFIQLFEPALYYEKTRGMVAQGGYGLFGGAMADANRFSFGVFNIPRLCSLFLEQVSLANFSMVLAIFTASFWSRLVKRDRILFLFTIILIILGNNTRTGSTFVVLMLAGFWVFPMLPDKVQVLVMPLVILFARMFIFDPYSKPEHWGDDLEGRVGLTMSFLSNLDIQSYLIGNMRAVSQSQDSGYVYLVCFSTIFGAIIYWLYTSLVVPGIDKQNKRFTYGSSLFIAINLMIGAAIFTIKVSAPLWLVGGFLYQRACLMREQKRKTYVSAIPKKS